MDFWKNNYSLLGQLSGYGAGFAAWLDLAKDIIGLVGVTAGAALSIWALVEKFKNQEK
jgi:hypothetical protein